MTEITDEMVEAAVRAINACELELGFAPREWGDEDAPIYHYMARAALTAALAARPEQGDIESLDAWPEEPTPEMIQAACDATFGPKPLTPDEAHRLGYAAMRRVYLKSKPKDKP